MGFQSGVNPDNIDSMLQRLAQMGVKGIGHIAAHDWYPEQLQRCRAAGEAPGCFIGDVTPYTTVGWPQPAPILLSSGKPACPKACMPPTPSRPTASASASLLTARRRRPVVESLASAGAGHGSSGGQCRKLGRPFRQSRAA